MLSFYPESLLNKAEIDETEFRRIVVRSMRPLLILLLASGLVGCAAQVLGPYSGSLSQQDIQQIQSLVAARSDIHFKTVVYIHVIRPGRVYVEASNSMFGPFIRSTFTAQKRAGKWVIDSRSIDNYDQLLMTS